MIVTIIFSFFRDSRVTIEFQFLVPFLLLFSIFDVGVDQTAYCTIEWYTHNNLIAFGMFSFIHWNFCMELNVLCQSELSECSIRVVQNRIIFCS